MAAQQRRGSIGAQVMTVQLLIASCLFYRKIWLKKVSDLLLALLIPLGLFFALEGN
jgi:hypothetical protein